MSRSLSKLLGFCHLHFWQNSWQKVWITKTTKHPTGSVWNEISTPIRSLVINWKLCAQPTLSIYHGHGQICWSYNIDKGWFEWLKQQTSHINNPFSPIIISINLGCRCFGWSAWTCGHNFKKFQTCFKTRQWSYGGPNQCIKRPHWSIECSS